MLLTCWWRGLDKFKGTLIPLLKMGEKLKMAKLMAENPNAPETREKHIYNDNHCADKARSRSQLTFTLVEQDISSPLIIAEWIKANIMTCPAAKLYDAIEIAVAMRDYKGRKHAD